MKESFNRFLSFAAKATYVFFLVGISFGILGYAMYRTYVEVNKKTGYSPTFSVEGKAKKKVVLDTAKVNLGVVLKDQTPVKVQEKASERYSKAIEAIKEIGIPEEDIQTQSYNVQTVYKPETNDVEGYEINLSLIVIIRNTNPESALVSKVINAATSSGFNSVNSMDFYLEDMESVQDALKDEAIQDAKDRAVRESQLAGIKIGKVVNMNSYSPMPYYDGGYGYERSMVANGKLGMDMAAAEALPEIQIQPGQTEVEVNVTLQYEIK